MDFRDSSDDEVNQQKCMSLAGLQIDEAVRLAANEELCNAFQEYLQRNDEWRGSSKSIANELRKFLKKPFYQQTGG